RNVDFNIEKYDDVVLELKEHLSYVGDIDYLNIEFIGEGCHIIECDYCGKTLFRNWTSRKQNGKGDRVSQKYKNKDDEYPFTNDACRSCVGRKNRVTNFINHGTTKNVKVIETMEKNGKIPTSRQQIYLANLLGAKLNKYVREIGGFPDMVLGNIIIEYDGSGHYAGVNYGRYTYSQKVEQDYERDLKLRSMGYKVIRIHSEYDYLPSDEVIVEEINNIIKHFEITGKEFFKWVIPKSKKDKRYGNLREIREEDLNR